MTIKSELAALRKASKGILRPERVVNWASQHSGSAIYKSLEWDDAKAANEHRIWQVRQMIAIHIVDEKGAREMVSLSIDRVKPGGGYRNITDVVSAPQLREILLNDAIEDLERAKAKYERLTELASVWMELEKVKGARQKKKVA